MKPKTLLLLIIPILLISIIGFTFASDVKDLKEAQGIKVSDDGKLIDTRHENKEIGNITPIKDTTEGETIIHNIDPEALNDVLSTKPLVEEYIVSNDDPTKDGIFFMFAHDGDMFLAFVSTDNMGGSMLKRMTEFCKYQWVV